MRIGGRALDILAALTERAGQTVSKEELIARAWPDTVVEEAALRVHVAPLRKTLGDGRAGKRYIANDAGRGYAFIAPVTRENASSVTVVPDGADVAGSLPALLTRIVGRDEIILALTTQLARRRFLTIVGPGGIGKTTVAVAVADRAGASYKDGVWFIELASLSDPDLVPSAVGAALGVRPSGGDHTRALAAWLRDKTALLVLDSCEHVIGAAASLAEMMLKAAIGVSILTTSREPLRAEGETLHRLATLELPVDPNMSADEALRYSAVQLFNERATAAIDGFVMADFDVPAVLEICRRLDGIPLALELPAARVGVFGVRELADHLDDRFRVLTSGRRTALLRHQTLAATLDWSYQLLSEAERTVLRRLSVFCRRFLGRRRWRRGRESSRTADNRPYRQSRREITARRRSARRDCALSPARYDPSLRFRQAAQRRRAARDSPPSRRVLLRLVRTGRNREQGAAAARVARPVWPASR